MINWQYARVFLKLKFEVCFILYFPFEVYMSRRRKNIKDKYFKYRNINKGARYSEIIPIKIIIDRCFDILNKGKTKK